MPAFVLFSCVPRMNDEGIHYANVFKRNYVCYEIIWGVEDSSIKDSILNRNVKHKFLRIDIVKCIELPHDSIQSRNIFIDNLANFFYDNCKNKIDYEGIVIGFRDGIESGDERYFYYLLDEKNKLKFVDFQFYNF